MDMQRELATDQRDLPHAYVNNDTGLCEFCGRYDLNSIHHFQTEQASSREVLQTEKGT